MYSTPRAESNHGRERCVGFLVLAVWGNAQQRLRGLKEAVMKRTFFAFLLVLFVLLNVRAFADSPISQGALLGYEAAPKAAYNAHKGEFLVVWNVFNLIYATTDPLFYGPVKGQRIRESGALIGTPFDIFSAGVLADIVYNPNNNEYLVVCEQWNNTVGQRLDDSGNKIGGQVTLISNSGNPRVLYNSLLHNYLVTGNGVSPNPAGLYTIQVGANGSPIGSPTNALSGSWGGYYGIAYAPLEAADSVYGETPTPGGRYMVAGGPIDPTMLDYQGKAINFVYDPDHGIWYRDVPFQPQGVSYSNYNIDVAFGYYAGNPVFFFVWSDIGSHTFCTYSWTGVMGGILDASRTFSYYTDPILDKPAAFPISWIVSHWAYQPNAEEWKPKVVYNAASQKFVVAWRETEPTPPATDPNDATYFHIRVNTWDGGVCPPSANIVASTKPGLENPRLPFVASSTTSAKTLIGWEDLRYFPILPSMIFGTSFDAQTRTASNLTKGAGSGTDFDNDGKADITAYRPSSNTWYTIPSTSPGSFTATIWGISGDMTVPGDYDGDGKIDVAVWRPSSGTWYILPSGTPGTYTSTIWGLSTDKPVPADYDGDGKADIAAWRPSTGTWYVLPSASPGAYTSTIWGLPSDIPVPRDYDGDFKADVAAWRPASGTWYILPSASSGSYTSTIWGLSTDKPVPADYDGDGKVDVAVWRPSSGTWYTLPSASSGTYTSALWGVPTDIPVSADYDGDGKADIAVWRPSTGTWYVLPSASPGTYTSTIWGLSSDIPQSAVSTILQLMP
jgi:hypothetical protein